MLARRTRLRHPSGVEVESPLLVPSFSSKGFRSDSSGRSEIVDALEITSEVLNECVLISAYDVFYRHISKYLFAELTFVDSGGYELSDEHDFSAVYRHETPTRPWKGKSLQRVLDKWPKRYPAVIISYDHPRDRHALSRQVTAARSLFSRYPDQLHDILLKPENRRQQNLDAVLRKLYGNVELLKGFHVVGVTEKELGDSMLDRMVNLAELRLAMDEGGVRVPLHIFGSLDPVSCCLYFLAGADIFDGLTWLRYSFLDGTAIYQRNYGALHIGVHEGDGLVLARALVDNIYYLRELQLNMRDFLLDLKFERFGPHAEILQRAYDKLRTRLGGKI